MSEPIWEDVRRDSLEANFRLGELLFSDPRNAVFRADYPDLAGNVRDVEVRLVLEDGRYPGEIVNRFLETKYFEHPHILRYFEAGTLLSGKQTVAYAVTERTDGSSSRSLTPEEALRFAQNVVSGLQYLHARDLVYCVLAPQSVVLVGADWKLSDFSQLRVAGTDVGDEALSLPATLKTCPPEAVEGLISPAWDIWSLGQTLQKVLPGYKANMSDPFRAIFLACININPSSRPTLTQLSALLDSAQPSNRGPATSATAHV